MRRSKNVGRQAAHRHRSHVPTPAMGDELMAIQDGNRVRVVVIFVYRDGRFQVRDNRGLGCKYTVQADGWFHHPDGVRIEVRSGQFVKAEDELVDECRERWNASEGEERTERLLRGLDNRGVK